ncbi:MAG: ATP-dependent DNA helicase RecG [Candidatus Pacebacteria bacterium]|nr:ATP-dependent DNA helicase RecG [Candidatus Paceibacterota bacterium]
MQLTDELIKHFRTTEEQKKALARLGLITIRDILYYFPTRYTNISELKLIRDLTAGDSVTIYGRISKLKTKKAFRSKMPMGEAEVEDSSGKIKVMWFNQAYMAKMVHEGDMVELSGKVANGKQGLYLTNPELKEKNALPIDTHNSLFGQGKEAAEVYGFPVYRETRGVTSRFVYHTIQKIIGAGLISALPEYLPLDILKKYNLPKLSTALVWIHAPQTQNDADAARKRFAFEEVFFIQLARKIERENYLENKSYPINFNKDDIADFTRRFPFKPTAAQEKAISTMLTDMEKMHPMARLLEGDVGSGKTAVAATLSYAAIKTRPDGKSYGNLQVAYMAPTEILATQHFENFIQYFKHTGISVGLITGSGCRKFPTKVASAKEPWTAISRTQLLKWVANGEIPILIGTHALIQKSVKFKHHALAIIDEQHRFGTMQRKKLVTKEGFAPHLLSMTATPIPRTLALTIYGDLDLSILDEMPAGRKPIITDIVIPEGREKVYEFIRSELKNGRQAYVICPRIDEPDPEKELAVQARSVTKEAEHLKKSIFPEYTIGVLHSKMTPKKKDEVMDAFSKHEIDILCATSVVEVGVNVPNATLIIIEGAERFGLAQLHQLRGRVIRSNHQAYCYLFAETKSEKTTARLKALKTAKNGFELSELDLGLRGAGELGGTKQWGITDLGMEAIKNIKMVEAARTEATEIIKNDPLLKEHPVMKTLLDAKKLEIHFE